MDLFRKPFLRRTPNQETTPNEVKLIMRIHLLISGAVKSITTPNNKKMTNRNRLVLAADCSERIAKDAIKHLSDETEPRQHKKRGRPLKEIDVNYAEKIRAIQSFRCK
jgi:hypothetical protein